MLAALSKFFSDDGMANAREGLKDKLIKEKKFFISGSELQGLIIDHFPDDCRTREILLTVSEKQRPSASRLSTRFAIPRELS